uniref:RNA-directed DNA polymerase homolog n=1 Tax=Nicotiana tabacum TaxID=4097 RepID=A0A1S3Z1X9_TOBAC|nr:PREDICTED: RNA-directed DNA polymerase homolog [Nicotiana tabacum]
MTLDGATVFTKIYMKAGYGQVWIAEGDEHKTFGVRRYGSYDFLFMSFSLTNAPTTFCTVMNQVFREYIDEFVVVYLDDILVYSKTLAEHLEHLRKVLARFRENELYVKLSKCSFAQK